MKINHRVIHLGLLLCLVALLPGLVWATPVFQEIPISPLANASLSRYYEVPPVGAQVFGGVPFTIADSASNVFLTEEGGDGINNPASGHLNTHVAQPLLAHILITGASVHNAFLGHEMGNIAFGYADGSSDSFRLVVGDTIRDWVAVPGVVVTTTNPDLATVWQGTSTAPWGYSEAVINMLTIPLSPDSPLTGISINDTSATSIGGISPGLFIYGATIEAVPEPSSLLALGSGLLALGGLIRRRR